MAVSRGGSPGEPLCQIVLVGRPKCGWREPFVTRREVALREGHERTVLSGGERLDTETAWVKVMIEAAVRKEAVEVIDRTEDRIGQSSRCDDRLIAADEAIPFAPRRCFVR